MRLFANVFEARIRGFRIIDLAAFGCLSVLVLGVYWFKAHAGGQSAKIAQVDTQIAAEERQVRLLQADLAHLEQPARLERLSTAYLNLAPISGRHEITPEQLAAVARKATMPAAPPAQPVKSPSGAAAR